MDEEDLISQILNENTNNEIEYNKNEYNVNSVLNSLGVDNIDVDNLNKKDSNTSSKTEESKIQKETSNPKDSQKETPNEQSGIKKENDIIKKEKDEQIKRDLEKISLEEKKKKDEEELNKAKKIDEKKQLDDFYPSFKDPLDFIQYLEVLRTSGQISEEMKNFILQKNRAEDNKYKVIETVFLPKITAEMTENDIHVLYAKNNHLVLCTTNGIILFYSIKTQKLKKKIIIPKSQKGIYINCFDLTDDFSEFICGYNDGTISVIYIPTEEVKYSNKIANKDIPCLDLKIYKKDQNKKELYFITSFADGQILFNTYKMNALSSFFRPMSSAPITINDKNPIFMVKFITFSKENQRLYTNLLGLKRYAILGSLEAITLYCVDPSEEIFSIKKPDFIKENVVPDAQIGIGRPPDVFIRFVKKDENNHLLLTISWGNIIFFYQLPIINANSIQNYKELGYYINPENIYRIGFMNNSVVFCLDETFTLTLLDSSKINSGKIEISNNQIEIPKKNNFAIIDKKHIASEAIKNQVKIKDKNNNQKKTFLYSIVDNNDSVISIVVLGIKQIYNLELKDWKFFLNTLQNNNDFINLFSVGINIYNGKMMALSNIPENKIKKDKVGDFLKQIVSQYVILNTGESEIQDERKISECIRMTIEFCIEIGAVEYLLKSIMQLFESKDYGELFLTKLQPFILCDKIVNFVLSSDIILNLIDLYSKNGKLDILSQMLLHINIKSIDTIEIRDKLEEMNLITPLIYLYMNGQEEDYFAPLEKMFYFFYNRAIPSKFLVKSEDYSIDYSSALTKKLMTLKEIRSCKEYNGHRILWYIKLCLTGKKFPDSSKKMEKNLFDALVPKIAYWLLNPKVIEEFLKFDPKNYFMLFKNIFSISDLYKKLLNSAKDSKYAIEVKSSLSSSNIKIENIEPSSLIKYLYEWCKKKDEKAIFLYLYDFIISSLNLNKELEIEKGLKLESICFIVKNFKQIYKQMNNEKINQMNEMIIRLLKEEKNFVEDDFKYIFNSIKDNNFDEVKLFLYNRVGDVREYLKIYLGKNMDIKDKGNKIYNWINDKLIQFEKDTEKYDKFIEILKENIFELASLSTSKFYELSKQIFPNQNKFIISKLSKDKNVQLKYIEYLIKYIIATYENNEYNVTSKEMDEIQYILDLHIYLLCTLNLQDKIIPSLKACPFYPLKKCLVNCENIKAYEPCLFINLKLGSTENAFKISSLKIEETFNKLIDNINNENNDKVQEDLINNFEKYLSDQRKICENNDQNLEDFWFQILEKLYKFEISAGDLVKKNELTNKKKNSEDLYQNILKDIKELMEKMCSYVSIKRIMEIVSERNKNAGFKEFREILIKILGSYSNLSSILHSARHLLTNLVLENENSFQSLNLKGELLSKQKCGKCNKKFNKNMNNKEKILIYNCNHIFHRECIAKSNAINGIDSGCPICSELQFGNIENKEKSLIKDNNISIIEERKDKNKFEVKVNASTKKTLQKLEKYDDRNLEKHISMIRNSITVLKDQYRVEYKE